MTAEKLSGKLAPKLTEPEALTASYGRAGNWYPGHIAKWDKALASQLKLVDVVLEVLDARLPQSTCHPELAERVESRPRVRFLNKTDVASPAQTKAWLAYYRKTDPQTPVLSGSTQNSQAKGAILKALQAAGQPRITAHVAKGLKPRPIRVLVVGMPNVGKSSLINYLVGKSKVATGHRAGVTRQTQWVRIHPQVELLDSPGIIPPRLDGGWERLALLAIVSSVGDAATEEQATGEFLLNHLQKICPPVLFKRYGADEPDAEGNIPVWSLETLAYKRQWLLGEGKADMDRAARTLLTEFRQGRLGPITLELPPVEQLEELEQTVKAPLAEF